MATESGKNKYNKYGQPSLDFVFAGTKKSLTDRVSGNTLQFTRDSVGTYVDADGLIKTAAAGEARFDHDPVTGESLGLLVEEARTNLVTYSQEFNDVSWYKNNVTATANTTAAPDGTTTAETLTCSVGGQTWQHIRKSSTLSAGTHTFSCYCKAGNISTIRLGGESYTIYATFTLTGSGSFSGVTAGASASIQAFPNGWYRCSLTYVSAGGTFNNDIRFSSAALNDTVYIWGAQLEASPYPTSYIPTTSSTVTRAADLATLTNNNIYNTENFTIINEPFGVSVGSTTLSIVGPTAKRATVHSSNLSQTNINAFVDNTDEFWQWRILGSSFALPTFTTDGQVTVDWGDGTVETLTTSEHTFTNGGGYHEIGFRLDSGTYFRPRINNNGTHKDKVVALGPAPESMKIRAQEAFNGCTNLQAFDPTITANGETNYSYAWQSCSSLKNFPLIDTSGVTYMLRTWRSCSGLENFAKIDTSSVYSLYEAWDSCSSLTSFPVIDTSNVTDFGEAWAGCSSLTEFPVLDTSKGTNFSSTWQSCSSLTEFPPQIDVSKCSNFSIAWRYCSGLTSFPALDFSAATNFGYTWMGCSSLASFPTLSTTSLAEQFLGTWYGCGELTTIPICDYSSATTFNGAWVNCNKLTTIPANLFDTTGTLLADAFNNAFTNDSLSTQSIENLLVSLVANGATGVTLGMNGGGNANTSTWSTAANNAYLELVNNRGWTITQNGTAPT